MNIVRIFPISAPRITASIPPSNIKVAAARIRREVALLAAIGAISAGQIAAHLRTPHHAAAAAALVLLVIAGWAARRRRPDVLGLLVLAAFAYVQMLWCFPPAKALERLEQAHHLDDYRTRSRVRRATTVVRGRLADAPASEEGGKLRFLLAAHGAYRGARFQLTGGDLPWQPLAAIERGAMLEAAARLTLSGSDGIWRTRPFSYSGYLYRRGIAAHGPVTEVVARSAAMGRRVLPEPWAPLLDRFPEALPTVLAAALGRRAELGRSVVELFRDLGLSHVLVVSGLHAAAVYGLVFSFFRALVCRLPSLLVRLPADTVGGIAGLAALGGYAAAVAPGLPVLRAVLVLSIFAVGSMFGRRAAVGRALLFSMVCILLVRPGAFFEVGFQLTYAAVAGLLCAAAWCGGLVPPEGRLERLSLLRKAARGLWYCFAAWLFTLPLVVGVFNMIVPAAPIINLLVVPLFTAVFLFAGGAALLACSLEAPGAQSLLYAVLAVGEQCIGLLFELADLMTRIGAGSRSIAPAAAWKASALLWLLNAAVLGWTLGIERSAAGSRRL